MIRNATFFWEEKKTGYISHFLDYYFPITSSPSHILLSSVERRKCLESVWMKKRWEKGMNIQKTHTFITNFLFPSDH